METKECVLCILLGAIIVCVILKLSTDLMFKKYDVSVSIKNKSTCEVKEKFLSKSKSNRAAKFHKKHEGFAPHLSDDSTNYEIMPEYVHGAKHVVYTNKRVRGETCNGIKGCKSPKNIYDFLTHEDKEQIISEVKQIVDDSQSKIVEKFDELSDNIKEIKEEKDDSAGLKPDSEIKVTEGSKSEDGVITPIPKQPNQVILNATYGQRKAHNIANGTMLNNAIVDPASFDDADLESFYYKYFMPEHVPKYHIVGANYANYINTQEPYSLKNDDLTDSIKRSTDAGAVAVNETI